MIDVVPHLLRQSQTNMESPAVARADRKCFFCKIGWTQSGAMTTAGRARNSETAASDAGFVTPQYSAPGRRRAAGLGRGYAVPGFKSFAAERLFDRVQPRE